MAEDSRRLPWLNRGDRWALAALFGVLAVFFALHWALASDWTNGVPTVEPGGPVEFHRLDLNRAEWWELMALPGIGVVKANRIVEYRHEHGPFTSVEQLELVSGFGPKTVSQLAPYLTVSGGKKPDEQPGR